MSTKYMPTIEVAQTWLMVIVSFVILQAVVAFFAFGNLFATGFSGDEFNAGAALISAGGTFVAWLPIIGAFHLALAAVRSTR